MKSERVPVGQVTQWLSGGTPNRSIAEYWTGEIPWISGSTLKGSEIHESDQHLTTQAVAVGSKMAPVGATLFLVRGSALHNEIRAGLVVAPVCFNQDVKALVPSPRIMPKFLTYSLLGRTQDLLKLVSTAGNSAGVLDTKLVQSFEIFLPPNPEQRAIAEALTDVDGLLGALEALIAKKRAIKQAAMQQLLTGKTRLPGFSGKWAKVSLGEVAPLQRGFDLPTSQIRPGPYPVVYSNGALNEHDTFMVKSPGVITGRSGTIGKVHYLERNYWPHNTSLWVTSFSGNDPKFIYYLYTHIDLSRLLSGSGVPTLNRNDVHQHLVSRPPFVEQTAIAAVLSDMDDEIAVLERHLDKTALIKQGMMQQLLTGRVRLVQPEMATEQAGP